MFWHLYFYSLVTYGYHNELPHIFQLCFGLWPNHNHTQRAHYIHHECNHPREYMYHNPLPPFDSKIILVIISCLLKVFIFTNQFHKNRNPALNKFHWHNQEYRLVPSTDLRNRMYRWTFVPIRFDKLPFHWSRKYKSTLSKEPNIKAEFRYDIEGKKNYFDFLRITLRFSALQGWLSNSNSFSLIKQLLSTNKLIKNRKAAALVIMVTLSEVLNSAFFATLCNLLRFSFCFLAPTISKL